MYLCLVRTLFFKHYQVQPQASRHILHKNGSTVHSQPQSSTLDLAAGQKEA